MIRSSKCPLPMICATMVGFEVAPVTPHARLLFMCSGSTPSSQTFVPVAISDARDIVALLSMNGPTQIGGGEMVGPLDQFAGGIDLSEQIAHHRSTDAAVFEV